MPSSERVICSVEDGAEKFEKLLERLLRRLANDELRFDLRDRLRERNLARGGSDVRDGDREIDVGRIADLIDVLDVSRRSPR